ncbi:MAG: putative lipid II flippase FtsW [Mycobacterium leprae]
MTAPAGGSTASSPPLLQRPLASYYLVVGCTALLLALGLVMVLSASSVVAYDESGSSFTFFVKQAVWVGLGLPLLWLAARLPVRAYRMLGYPLLVVSLFLLLLVLVPGVGHKANGATRWIDLGGPLRVQPSEPAKLALVLWGADLLVRKRRLLTEWKHLLVPLLPVTGLLVLLVMVGRDLGTSLVILTIFLALLWVVGAPARLFALVVTGIGAVVTLMIITEPYRIRRITGFLNPFADLQGSGWQGAQGIYALASGGWVGLGLGASREKWDYLPHAHTDFIYAIIGEELGLVGAVVVLLLFATLAYAGVRIAQRTRDPFARLAAGAVTAWLAVQAFVNIGAVLGVLPITGIPLPLISFGGSALLPTMVALGMLLSFAKREPGAPAALAARAAAMRARLPWLPDWLLAADRTAARVLARLSSVASLAPTSASPTPTCPTPTCPTPTRPTAAPPRRRAPARSRAGSGESRRR